MKKIVLIAILALVLSTVNASAGDPDIETFYATPNNPYEDTHFDVFVRAEDNDGIDKIKFYADGRLEETEDCDDEDECAVYFDVYESTSGYHVYKVKIYDTEDDTETDEIEVYVRPSYGYYPYGYCGDGRCGSGENTYNCAQDCRSAGCVGEGQSIVIYPGAPTCCAGLSAISPVSPNSRGVCPSTPLVGSSICTRCGNGVCGRGENKCNCPRDCPTNYCGDGTCNVGETRYNCPNDCGQPSYCGDGACNSGESCATCPSDCGACVTCGDGRCSSTESCSSCPQDCGNCQRLIPTVIYTCEQRGGDCCTNGGQGVVSGAADCPSTCFSECNPASEPEPTPGGGSAPTGAVVIGGTSLIMLGGLVILLLLVVFIAARVR